MFDAIFPKHWTTLQRLMWLKTNALARAVYEIVTGNPVTFTAKSAPLRQLKVAFSPVQDLHGYDSPWPAGGGVNLLPTIVAGTYELNGVKAVVAENGVITVTGQKTTSSGITLLIPLENAYTPPSGCYYHLRNSAVSSSITVGLGAGSPVLSPVNRIWQSTATPSETSQMSIYLSGAVTEELNFTIQPSVELTNSVTAWSPYSNICPISGWSSLTVEQRGKNLFDPDTATAGYITGTGGHGSQTTALEYKSDYILIPDSVDTVAFGYSAYEEGNSPWGMIALYDASKTFIARQGSVDAQTGMGTYKFRNYYPSAKYVRFTMRTYGHGIDKCFGAFGNDTTYTPYNPLSRSISISLGDTYYSGTLDVVTGVLTVTWAKLVLDGTVDPSGVNWRANADSVGWYYSLTNLPIEIPANIGTQTRALCDTLKPDTYNNLFSSSIDGFAVTSSVGTPRVCVRMTDTSLTTKETVNAYLHDNPITIVYPLATPISIQLTPQEVQSLLGENVLFSDANGNLTVEYRSN